MRLSADLTTWNTFYASTYWNMSFSVAGAAMDAHVLNDIMLRDWTRNLSVVGRQPHPNPNYAPYSSGVGALAVRLRRTPLVRFKALLGLFRMARSYRPALLEGIASALKESCFYPMTPSRSLYPCL